MPPRRASASPKGKAPEPPSPAASTSTSSNSPARRKYFSWTGDNAARGSQSSQDVLLAWLATPRNCARWAAARQSREARIELCREVVVQLRTAGIRHRSDTDVYARLGAVERGFLSAKRWLEETALLPAFLGGRASKDVVAHVRQLCTHYKELAPAFAATSNAAAAAKVVDIGDDDDDEEGENEEGGEKGDVDSQKHQSNGHEPTTLVDQAASSFEPEADDACGEDSLASATPTSQKANAGTSPIGRFELISSSQESGELPVASASTRAKDPPTGRERAEEEEEAKVSETPSREQKRPRQRTSLGNGANGPQQPTKVAAKKRGPAASKSTNSTTAAPTSSAGDTQSAAAPSKRRTSGALREAVAIATASSGLEEPSGAPRKKKQKPQEEAQQKSLAAPEKRVPYPEELAAILKACEEERDQRNKLFELQCDALLQELEEKKIRVVVETAVARKKLLDLGVEPHEVDRILPL